MFSADNALTLVYRIYFNAFFITNVFQLEIIQKEIEKEIQSIDMDHHFVQHVGKAAEQRQEIFIDDQPVNPGGLSVLESSDEFEVVAPDGQDYIKITRFDLKNVSYIIY